MLVVVFYKVVCLVRVEFFLNMLRNLFNNVWLRNVSVVYMIVRNVVMFIRKSRVLMFWILFRLMKIRWLNRIIIVVVNMKSSVVVELVCMMKKVIIVVNGNVVIWISMFFVLFIEKVRYNMYFINMCIVRLFLFV